MRERIAARAASDNCMVFANESRMEVRVVYEPDGKPLFCASDLAACMGYAAPCKFVARLDISPKHRRFVPWVSTHKRGRSEAVCYDRSGVEQLLRHGVPSEDCKRWVLEELIPRAEDIGAQRGYTYEEPDDEPYQMDLPPAAPRLNSGILERLDSIIMEAVMLKKEIMERA